MDWKSPGIQKLLQLALHEDQARQDITTHSLIQPRWKVRAEIRAKQHGVICGLPFGAQFFSALDPHARFVARKREGATVVPGDCMAVIQGRAQAVLSAERPAMNAIQHLSGISTYTRQQVERLGSSKTILLDTRKTLPGWRLLEKYAVRCGGATNHRMSLGHALMIKDNHLNINRLAGGDWKARLKKRLGRRSIPIQMEVQSLRDLGEALALKPHLVLLDNLSVGMLKKMIRILRRDLPKTLIEVTGGVRPEDLKPLARLGVDRISMGRLTHSTPAFDCSLEITDVRTR